MTPRNRYTFFIDAEQRERLRNIKSLEGIPESEQIRRAINAWLTSRDGGVNKPQQGKAPQKAAPRRAATRRKA